MAGIFSAMLGGGLRASSDDMTIGRAPTDDFWYGPTGRGSASIAGRRVTPDIALQVSTVYACVSVLSKMLATIPLRMYRKGTGADTGKSFEAPEHPLNDLLEYQPNRWQTAWDFKAYLMLSVVLRGNGYAQIMPGPRGFADRLEPIHPDRVTVDRLPDGTLRYGISQQNGQTQYLLQDEVFHVRSHIAPGLVGIGPMAYARETIGLSLAAEEHGARTFSNGARPQGIVTVPKEMSDPAFKRFSAEWALANNGLAGAGRTPILEDGAEFKPITMTSLETQFLETRQFQIEEIARWFDVPLVMLHHMTNQTSWGTGVEAIMLGFVRNNLMPWLRCWTDAIRRDLILVPNLYEARFDVDELQRGDSKAQADFFSRLVLNGVLTRNEARVALGWNPLPGLDKPLTPTNTTTSDNLPGTNKADPAAGNALLGPNGGSPLADAALEIME
jgi:HK97 family phage portal protein